MKAIESVDEINGVAVIEAGAVLQDVQEQLAEKDLLFPLDLGARGSCTIGGTVATNAGGINVLRYGMMRNLVLGLEVVMADGTVVSSMNQMLKNNTGYDVKQLFIGSEGTLGVVTRVVVNLFPMPTSRQTAMFATESFEAVIRVLKEMQSGLAGTLSAYEVMWNNYYCAVTVDGAHEAPMARDNPYYVLAEAEGADPVADEERFQNLLHAGMESSDIADGNLHIFVKPHEDGKHKERSDRIVYGCLDGLDGSVSAEHGIGVEKKAWLSHSRSVEEIALMRGMKQLFDPRNILNPGKVID